MNAPPCPTGGDCCEELIAALENLNLTTVGLDPATIQAIADALNNLTVVIGNLLLTITKTGF